MPTVFLKDGATGAQTNSIGMSPDGLKWDWMPKAGLQVGGLFRNITSNETYPFATRLTLTFEKDNRLFATIEVQDVVNQATWIAETDPQKKLALALNDVGTWLANAYN